MHVSEGKGPTVVHIKPHNIVKLKYLQSRKHHFGDNLWKENIFGLAASSWKTNKHTNIRFVFRLNNTLPETLTWTIEAVESLIWTVKRFITKKQKLRKQREENECCDWTLQYKIPDKKRT